jgi:hypothetical protein
MYRDLAIFADPACEISHNLGTELGNIPHLLPMAAELFDGLPSGQGYNPRSSCLQASVISL